MTRTMLIDMNIGDKYTTKSRSITARDIDTFCQANRLSEDFFLSDDGGKAVGLRGRVAPGAQILTITSGLLEEVAWGLLLVAMDKVKFLVPLSPGDSVNVEIELLSKKMTSKGDRVFFTYSWVLKNQDGVVIAQGEDTECTTKP